MKAERGRGVTGVNHWVSTEFEPELGTRVPWAPPFPLSTPHHTVLSLEQCTGSKGFRHKLGTNPHAIRAARSRQRNRRAGEPGQVGEGVTATQAAVLPAQDFWTF